ncbi:TcdA/TcdB catalytic glycosyltransferase domain-containing protein [Legionella micdadei]|uniref:TcdA/TcdB catalytic glycosyltransferase domain-containing protein n=1 Tax=Legionella micdadei TaxID=451 RepID=A0A098GGU9_LEGMI|nr:TcdA/TcdB catalytic glycosyltransferase domain-containing protein [Legionella micdadei]ARG96912.1 hypothetical protein B6N58_04085 [Legionella micdadei]ARG99645.1 hypothetical protein B6V88_04000 [Legionella micdadei]KTD26597.1 putative teichoic acid biosynthesis protein [Legionella micdadei]NSL17812.1 hypothetical protein [Legionella micdadei]CEG61684.1 protein of unknown function [Legionella micdadei]
MAVLPKDLHFVWLGKVPDKQARENIMAWKNRNPDYTVRIWIDSELFLDPRQSALPGDETSLSSYDDYMELVRWARENQIIIADIARKPLISHPVIQHEHALYQEMPARDFFNDEIEGLYRNYAAASDMLRVEILFQRGGFYADAQDVHPGEFPLGDIDAPHGFLFNQANGTYNNDFLASVANGSIISAFREAIVQNYQALYQDPDLTAKHRNSKLGRFISFFGSGDYRVDTTSQTSGPQALAHLLKDLYFSYLYANELSFDPKFYSLPAEQAASWHDAEALSKVDNLNSILRNFVVDFFIAEIEKKMDLLNTAIKKEKKWFRRTDQSKVENLDRTVSLLTQLKHNLKVIPAEYGLEEIYSAATSELNIDRVAIKEFLTQMKQAFLLTEQVIEFADARLHNEEISIEHYFSFIKEVTFFKNHDFNALLRMPDEVGTEDFTRWLVPSDTHLEAK